MKSPFPGMDPYLESRWSDVHVTLISAIKRFLQPILPQGLRARAEERVLLEAEDGESRGGYKPDVAVIERVIRQPPRPSASGTSIVFADSFDVRVYEEPEVERWIKIIDARDGGKVITVIEVLSPANKAAGAHNERYRRKLDDCRRAGVSVVEIDLLRWPSRARLEVGNADLPADQREPYLACIRRAWKPEIWQMCPLSLRKPLPIIPVPLREGEPDAPLDLQRLIDTAYDEGGYAGDIDYTKPPEPPLDPQDAQWAQDLIKSA